MKWFGKSFFVLLVSLVIYQLIVAWIWHIVGFQWGFGLVLYIIEGILLPIGIGKFVVQEAVANDNHITWKWKAYWSLSLLFLASFMVERYVWMIVSGYQAWAHDWGGGVGQMEAVGQWMITSLVLWRAITFFEFRHYRKTNR